MDDQEFDAHVAATETREDGTVGGLDYCLLKLCAEAGEVAGLRGKEIRVQGCDPHVERVARYALELGDVLWYLHETARLLGLTVDQVKRLNVMKLQRRRARNVAGTRATGKDPEGELREAIELLDPVRLPVDGERWRSPGGGVHTITQCRGDYCCLDDVGTHNRRHMVSEGWVLVTAQAPEEFLPCQVCGDLTRHREFNAYTNSDEPLCRAPVCRK